MRHSLDDLQNGRLAGAQRVKISEGLTEVPRDIFALADTLEILDLTGNSIDALPDDFARLSKLRVLFLSDNDFTVFPKVLAQCPELTMIGFKANKIAQLPENVLPPRTRWLILTDNKLTQLPDSMGDLGHLQKLMLAGNELQSLPLSMSNCRALELLRISANQLSTFPDALIGLPKLAWLAFSGNPFCAPFPDNAHLPEVSFDNLSRGKVLGEGASGVITQAEWIAPPNGIDAPHEPIAVKTFKGSVTSDGYPHDELAASLAAGAQDGLIPILAKITSDQQTGLAMKLIDPRFTNLGQPPNFETCTRDVFLENTSLTAAQILNMAQTLSRIMVHLRGRHICHGDLYAHNILVNDAGEILLGDFGAASNYAALTLAQTKALEAIEVRAFGCFLEDILSVTDRNPSPENNHLNENILSKLDILAQACLQSNTEQRPNFDEIQERLFGITIEARA